MAIKRPNKRYKIIPIYISKYRDKNRDKKTGTKKAPHCQNETLFIWRVAYMLSIHASPNGCRPDFFLSEL